MPLVAHSQLPSFSRLESEGEEILGQSRAHEQHIRELHIGLLNMMPDAALEATERQFMRLIGGCNKIAQFYVHPFTVKGVERSTATQSYIDRYYRDFAELKQSGLDALIITGANVPPSSFEEAPFWGELQEVLAFAKSQVTSTLCACLATHAAVYEFHGLEREPLAEKRWGVFSHRLQSLTHPLVRNINTRFDVPHSRLNDISAESMLKKGLHLLVGSEMAGAHLAVSPDGFRFVYFQGHPEYDRNSLLKEYKREIGRFLEHAREDYPPLPDGYFDLRGQELLKAFQHQVLAGTRNIAALEGFPEENILSHIDNTWGDTAKSVFNNWLGITYQITNRDRRKPLMEGLDPSNPIGFLK